VLEICNIVLADDHVLFREGMKRLIEEDPKLKVVGEVGTSKELIKMADRLRPDLAILDISMPGGSGIDIIPTLKKICGRMKIMILTMHKQRQYLFHAVSSGANAYLVKEDSDEEFFAAIGAIQKGLIYITRQLRSEIRNTRRGEFGQDNKRSMNGLTMREKEVLELVVGGKKNREIAGLLNISIRTVENHRANMKKKLNLNKAVDLVRYAIQMGIYDIPV
jgi:DNA-binding NarL/FixJ family response regulator